MRVGRSHVLLPVIAALAIATFSQGDVVAQQARFRTEVNLVTLDVCVRDAAGRIVPGLGLSDFLVFENGVAQEIAVFEPAASLPINAVLLVDRSASMSGEKLERAKVAASEFAASLGPRDRLTIIAFNQRATRVGPDGEFGGVLGALRPLKAGGTTALYDAMMVAVHELERERARRASPTPITRDVIIVLSDGEDTSSVVGFDEVLPTLRKSGALVYALSLRVGRNGEYLGATWPLAQLAVDTGARAMGVPRLDALSDLYTQITHELRNMYRVGYVSREPRARGEWREIAVRVRAPDTRVRTRSGYYAR